MRSNFYKQFCDGADICLGLREGAYFLHSALSYESVQHQLFTSNINREKNNHIQCIYVLLSTDY